MICHTTNFSPKPMDSREERPLDQEPEPATSPPSTTSTDSKSRLMVMSSSTSPSTPGPTPTQSGPSLKSTPLVLLTQDWSIRPMETSASTGTDNINGPPEPTERSPPD